MSGQDIGSEYSTTLAKAIGAESLNCIGDMPVLSDEDVVDLKGILKGTKTTTSPIDTKQAISILAHAERSVESVEIVGQILARSSESTKVRVSAAASLGVMGTEAAEKVLLASLNAEDPFVRSQVIKSIGKMGSSESLRRLESLPETASDLDRKLADFARMAITFREGAHDKESVPGIDWRSQSIETVEGDRVVENIRKIWGSTYGVELNREIGLSLVCGRSTLSVLLNRDLKRGSWLETLQSRPLIAGIVTAMEREVGRYSVRYLLMTTPTESGLTITGVRTDGEAAFGGRATLGDRGLQLTVRDVGPGGAPAEIDGVVTSDSFQLDLRTWGRTVRSKKHGEAVTV